MDTLIQNNQYVPKPYADYFLNMRNKSSQKHDVLVAVMDTGVDPSAFGLTSCPDGSKKVVDVIDCTGSDDVIVKLVTPKDVAEYLASIYDHMGLRTLDSTSSTSVISDLVSIYNEFSDCKFYKGYRSLRSFMGKRQYNTFGKQQQIVIDSIVLNVVVYKDSTNNPVCIVDYDGTSNNFIVLEEYHIAQEYGQIPIGDNLFLTFGFHLYNSLDSDSQICSLVFDTGSHATHVAGIIGGCFINEEMNGINPHCKILSLKIGDSRVDGMETSISLIRALQEIVKRDCHIVNYSYGEPVSVDKGRFIDMLNEYTFKHNILFITSVGNSGPSMGTIGAPGVMTDRTLNVGAYTNSTYRRSLYNMCEGEFTEGVYDWSSRGPSMNDDMGVSVIAPGCALTSHPRWNKSNIKMCNGTSMAAPNAAGFMSLILSQFEKPADYPHVYWLLRYAESTCKTIANVELESFSQGHGLIGQIDTDINDYFNCKPCTYYYDVIINDDASKKGIINFSDNTDCINNKKNDYTIDLKLTALPGNYCKDFRANNAIHSLIMNENTDLKIGTLRFVSHVDAKPIRVSISGNHYSGYIKFYEIIHDNVGNKFMRYVRSVAVNQYAYTPIKVSETKTYHTGQNLKPGEIRGIYVLPKGNILSVKLNGGIGNKVFVDIIQHYASKGYDKRSQSKTFISNQPQAVLTANILPNIPTEVCIYTPWSASTIENVNINIACEQKDVTLDKHLYEMSEKVSVNIGKYADETNNHSFKGKLVLECTVTKYHPFKAELSDTDLRYVDKDGKRLKSLLLHYKINKHPNCTYYINANDRVYDSKVHMSGCITGFYHDRKVFFANYVPKKVNNVIDYIVIEFRDSDEKVLKECMNTVLTATRAPSTLIETELILKQGFNLVDIPIKDILKLNNVYDGDYLQFNVLNTVFMVMFRKTLQLTDISNTNTSNKSNTAYESSMKQLMTDFTLVKKFINRVSSYNNYGDQPILVVDKKDDVLNNNNLNVIESSLCFVDPDSFNASDKVDQYKKFIDMSIHDRDNHEYVGTLFFEHSLPLVEHSLPLAKTSSYSSEDADRFRKRLKTTHEHFSDRKLLNTPPYNVIDLAQSIVNNSKSLDDIDNKMEIISSIERNMHYWNNCSIKNFDVLRKAIINNVSTTSSDSNTNNNNRLFGYKRKCNLMLNTNESVF